ncbi:MAG: hypothetical protein ACOYXO_05485, partial [Chloroflexota bacterium]
MNILKQILDWLHRLFSPSPSPLPSQPQGQPPQPITRKVMMIVFDPFVPEGGTQRLSQYLNWSDADALANQYIQDLHTCSHGYLTYQIVEKMSVDGFPLKKDGFVYSVSEYLQAWQNQTGFHQPDLADYARIFSDFSIIQKINSGIVDEVWLFGMPYAGFYESMMVGTGAF